MNFVKEQEIFLNFWEQAIDFVMQKKLHLYQY